MLEYCESFRARQDNHHSSFRAKRKAAPPAAKKHSPKADEAVRQLKTRRTPQPHFAPKRQSRFPDLRSPPPYAFSDRSNGACMDAPSYSDGFAPESHRIPFPLSGLGRSLQLYAPPLPLSEGRGPRWGQISSPLLCHSFPPLSRHFCKGPFSERTASRPQRLPVPGPAGGRARGAPNSFFIRQIFPPAGHSGASFCVCLYKRAMGFDRPGRCTQCSCGKRGS